MIEEKPGKVSFPDTYEKAEFDPIDDIVYEISDTSLCN